MYTLSLQEVKLNPPIAEDMKFENEDRLTLQNEAAAYIINSFGETYNPVTVERLVKSAVRDAQGKTDDELFNEEHGMFMENVEASRAQRQVLADEVTTEYAPKNADLESWIKIETDKIYNEYIEKIAAASGEEKEQLKEEQQLKLDDLKLEFHKKSDALWSEQSDKEQQVWLKE